MSNQVTLVGSINSQITYDHTMYGERYLRLTLSVQRTSGVVDNIPVLVSERLIDLQKINIHSYVVVKGQFRSYNSHDEDKTRLILFVFATEIELTDTDNYNDVFLEGYIIKPPIYRLTPLGREISDILLCVPREYDKRDYIPCIAWGRTAKYVSKLVVGTCIRVAGRVQSRDYIKDCVNMTAYEISVNLVEECG